MIKPNIRGVNKRQLKFSWAGWLNSAHNTLIQHRYPWRRNWVEQVRADASLQPLLARSGYVYLLHQATTGRPGRSRGKATRIVLFALGGVSVFLFVALPTLQVSDESIVTPSSAALKPTNCQAILNQPENTFRHWLKGGLASKFKITETQRTVIGGVQLRKVSVSCDQLKSDYKLTLALTNGEWQLKKFARLEN